MGQGRGEEGKEEVKRATFPTLLTMIVQLIVVIVIFKHKFTSVPCIQWCRKLYSVDEPVFNGTVYEEEARNEGQKEEGKYSP